MSFIEKRRAATAWIDYYQVYKEAYVTIAQRCFLGGITFGQHVHHSAVPDAQGNAGGFLNWVAYSQPSSRTLSAYLPTLADVLTKEPQRSNSRYLLLSSDESSATSAEAGGAFVAVPFPVDYWLGALPLLLASPANSGALLGAEMLFGDAGSADNWQQIGTAEDLLGALRQGYSKNSRVPLGIRQAFSDSFFLFCAYERGISVDKVIEILGKGAWLAAALARTRLAHEADSSAEFVESVLEATKGNHRIHLVKAGETLSEIVRRTYGMSFDTMWPLVAALNPKIHNPDRIFPNQELLLPALEE